MPKPRIPLPKQVGGAHKAETDYDRRREQQVSLDEVYSEETNQQTKALREKGEFQCPMK